MLSTGNVESLPRSADKAERIKGFQKVFYKCIDVSTRVGLEISRSVKPPDVEDYCMQQGRDHVVCSKKIKKKKKNKCCKRQTFCLIQPSKPGKGSRHQTEISIGSSKFLFYNSYFLSMTVPRPGGAVIPSEPPLPARKLLSFCSVLALTSCQAEKAYPGLWRKGEFGPVCFIVFSEVWHGQITGVERKNPDVSLPGLNVGIAPRGLIQNSAKSTAKHSFMELQTPFNGAGDGFVLDRRSQKTCPWDRQTDRGAWHDY